MVKNIFCYLAHVPHYKLTYHCPKVKPHNILSVYSHSSYAHSLSDRRSCLGSFTVFARCTMAWNCGKQGVVVLWMTEAEYIAHTSATQSLHGDKPSLLKSIGPTPVLNWSSIGTTSVPTFSHTMPRSIDLQNILICTTTTSGKSTSRDTLSWRLLVERKILLTCSRKPFRVIAFLNFVVTSFSRCFL